MNINLLDHWDKVFWLLFIIIGAIITTGTLGNLFIFDIILGVAVIIIGVQKLAEEIRSKRLASEQEKISSNAASIFQWLNSSHAYTKKIKTRTDNRFYHMDNKRIKAEKRADEIENDIDILAKKMIELENKLNEIIRVFLRKEKVRSGRGGE
jgi:hypothetical protein